MQTEKEYIQREITKCKVRLAGDFSFFDSLKDFHAELDKVSLETTDWFATQGEWMLNGTYGHGEMLILEEALKRKRGNKVANVGSVYMSLLYGHAYTSKHWAKPLGVPARAMISKAVTHIIDTFACRG